MGNLANKHSFLSSFKYAIYNNLIIFQGVKRKPRRNSPTVLNAELIKRSITVKTDYSKRFFIKLMIFYL